MARKLSPDGRRSVFSSILSFPSCSLARGAAPSSCQAAVNPFFFPLNSIRTIIIATPFLVASSILMYKRLVLGEEQKHLPRPNQGPSKEMIEAIKEAERKRGI
ncbi:hypothetical protein BCR35DRAFT_311479 [Leucosporidium creatinivorum]|uniref:Uncharacterized protein n=1 Tax=Leucosporidium creatinivorum TaxID=106004 RepID=A0A1Y2BXT7_9BASI|nr:hypothetical protein BCR35DRAFT_311479 [Leucosporidium creatinivorum]